MLPGMDAPIRSRSGSPTQDAKPKTELPPYAQAAMLLLGPLVLVVGWVILIANAGNGANDTWFVGHLILFAGNAAWVPIATCLGRMSRSPRSAAAVAVGLVLVGSLAVAGQLAIDMTAWALSLNTQELGDFFADIRARPILTLLVHTVGPSLLYLGVLVLAVKVAAARPQVRSGAVFVGAGVIVVAVGVLLTFSVVVLGGYSSVVVGLALIGLRAGADSAHG